MLEWLLGRIRDPYICIRCIPSQDGVDWWNIQAVNEEFCKWVGVPENELVSRELNEVLPEVNWQIFQAKAVENHNLPPSVRPRSRNGHQLEIYEENGCIHALWVRENRNPIWSHMHDMESENQVLKYRLQKTQEMAGIGDWYNNLLTQEEYWSDELYRMLGVEPHSFPPSFHKFNEFIEKEDLPRVRGINVRGTNVREYQVEFRLKDMQGNPRWMHTIGKLKRDAQGKPIEVYGLTQDITDYKRIEEELRSAKEEAERANLRKSTYLANMSHEVRIPLSGIAGMTDLLLKTPLNRDQRELADYIKHSSDSLIQMINDILDYSKMESGKMQLDCRDFKLRTMVQTVMRSFELRARNKGLNLALNIDENLPEWIHADPTRIQQILNNLISNAVKFTMTGSVTVSLQPGTTSEGAQGLSVSVEDTGVGIPLERQPVIFEAYEQGGCDVTEKFGGTGLGLAICKRLAELMDGTIDLESRSGSGTRVICTLGFEPASEATSVQAHGTDGAREGSVEGLRLLVAEDNFINRLFLTKLLEEVHRCRITAVDNGQTALELLQTETFDCVLMDGHLPGMEGIDVARAFRAYEQSKGISPDSAAYTPMIALTAEALKGDDVRYLNAGMDHYLTKPIMEDTLVELLGRIARKEKGPLTESTHKENPWSAGRVRFINRQGFESFARHLSNDEVRAVLWTALREYPVRIQEAETALWREDTETFRGLIHSLRGSLGYFGSERLNRQLLDLESKALNRGIHSLTIRYKDMKSDLHEFISELKTLESYYSFGTTALTDQEGGAV